VGRAVGLITDTVTNSITTTTSTTTGLADVIALRVEYVFTYSCDAATRLGITYSAG